MTNESEESSANRLSCGGSSFPLASQELLESRLLQNRTDTKFVIHSKDLPQLLDRLQGECAAIANNRSVEADYENLYFDSDDLRCLRDHQRGLRPRFKVRIRHHVSREMSFLEIKRKGKNESTVKSRRTRDFRDETLCTESLAFIEANSNLQGETLRPKLRIRFTRIGLVGLKSEERITLDQHLSFTGEGEASQWSGLTIVEVKQARFDPQAPILMALRYSSARMLSISKYCLGAHLCLPKASTDWYGKKIHLLRTLIDG